MIWLVTLTEVSNATVEAETEEEAWEKAKALPSEAFNPTEETLEIEQ